jgi:hypothetical protein
MAGQPGEDAMTLAQFDRYLSSRGYHRRSNPSEMMSPTDRFLMVYSHGLNEVTVWENKYTHFTPTTYPTIETVAELVIAHLHFTERYS